MKNLNDGRNSGIDFLRIISAYCIILLHIMGHGGIRDSLDPGSINFYILWFVMLASFCGVNCFALISGYVGYNETEKKHKSARFIDLWFQVVFYCFISVFLFKVLNKPDIGVRDFIEAFFPITFEKYWYFSAYLGAFIIMPLINKCIREFSNFYLIVMSVVGVGSLSFMATIITRYSDPFSLNGGYGVVWLAFLYFLGAIVKKFNIEKRIKVSTALLIVIGCLMVTWIWKVVLISIVGHGIDDLLVIYISPTILLMSICLLILFSNIKCNDFMTRLISIMVPTAFGIYLFQDSNYFRKYIVSGQYTGYAFRNPLEMVSLIILTGVVQFLISFIIDKCRCSLFKALRIKKISNLVGDVIDNTVNKTSQWIDRYLNADNTH